MGSAGFDIGNELNNSLNYIFGTPCLCSTLVIPTYLAFLRGVLCSGDIAAVVAAAAAALAGESIWSSDGVEALEVHECGEPDLSRSGDSAGVNLQRRLCWRERERGHDTECSFVERRAMALEPVATCTELSMGQTMAKLPKVQGHRAQFLTSMANPSFFLEAFLSLVVSSL